ncbi:extracellular catalytic domain type 1 short-chain-length polyhydroxyalkanoate depolymerase [Methylobacterium sp. Leaf85]|uniref:extracellular catalytic domain type 1 short-chain-length polyhydroxyalkanoate depolymerase n=1 Tax=Methylobacterium sp. Leaf85 TaxID=1736241 RepID=UPI0007010670|nr:PHB depolymerase family esterase [Methylobacterium sp. Leaf85]KQO45960.1 esterase [Methylobacterium sp. Leaf85]
MTAFSTIDMGEVTRLTRAGQLSEAMALLQGRPVPSTPTGPHAAAGTIDMVAPTMSGGAWTAPGTDRTSADGAASTAKTAFARPGLAETIQTLRERFPKMGAMPDLGQGIGSARGATVAVPEGARFEERSFGNEAGSRAYKVYVPSGYRGQALPVVVMLHGCTQNPDDFAAGTRMNALAEEQTFLVAYPGQPQSANMQKCWNWFNAGDQQRGRGEPSLIAGIALEVVKEFSADPSRVYAAGLSAGGAAAAIMAATYPDVFAAVGVHSGLPCGAASDMPSAFAAMNGGGTSKAPQNGPGVPTIVFHGDADKTVKPVNGEQVIALAMPGASLARTATQGTTESGMGFTRTVRTDASGRAMLEHWALHGAGHAWSGGSSDGTYTDPRGPDASREMVRFFMTHANRSS